MFLNHMDKYVVSYLNAYMGEILDTSKAQPMHDYEYSTTVIGKHVLLWIVLQYRI